MDNNIVMAIFEEIKNDLQKLGLKIEKQVYVGNQEVALLPNERFDDDLIEKLHELFKADHSDIINLIDNVNSQIYKSRHIVTNEVAEIKMIVAKNKHQYHQHRIEIGSSKVVITIVVLSLAIIGSLTCNLIQVNENNRLQNNDWKYRSIKAFGGVDSDKIRFLEDVYNDEADQDTLQKNLTKLIDFENELAQRAADIDLAQQKEESAKQLMDEAEKIRKKK
jgi:hypothetical protein